MSTVEAVEVETPTSTKSERKSLRGDPTWELALDFPRQGDWTEEAYLALETNRPVELSQGCLVFLPMSTLFHQLIGLYLRDMLKAFLEQQGIRGVTAVSPLQVRMWPGEIREPDVVFFRRERIRNVRRTQTGADLVMEVVSPGKQNTRRDHEIKRRVYAEADIPEYWVVDPQRFTITVLQLDGENYRVHGEFTVGNTATSATLPGFAVDVAETFAAGEAGLEDEETELPELEENP